ncbi:MAG: class I tRNA ligase family protein, partial [Candidatus Cloacimonetes bacterium]|nr:class I tRNA ligase family protein [Candidatus Cloacimonadota bacterium]
LTNWMSNIQDWCVSRQIWWGHRIPAYYCEECGELIVSADAPTHCPKCASRKFRQDEDVLDTWFSSWLWPFSTMGWPEETEDLNYFLPTSLLVTGHEIIYLWVARMIMATLEFRDTIPFDTVYLHGIVRDEIGRKMSKSLGNSPDPIDIIEKVGADALRFGIIFNTPKGADSYYSDALLENGRNFANKIWNAYRYIMMNAEQIEGLPTRNELRLELADKWIYSRLNEVAKEVADYYENLRFNDAASTLMKFIWDEFCSWYLELTKERIYNQEDCEGQLTAKYILLDVMQSSMRLLHPIMPFITEEVWQGIKTQFPMEEEALIIALYPIADESMISSKISNEMSFIQETITAIRNLRKQINLNPGVEVEITVVTEDVGVDNLYKEYLGYLSKLAKVSNLIFTSDKPEGAIAAVVGSTTLYLSLEGLIDMEAEREKLNKQIEKLQKEFDGIQRKLANADFISRAKPEVVEKENEKYKEVKEKLDKTRELLDGLK